jgi:hypothetical protein
MRPLVWLRLRFDGFRAKTTDRRIDAKAGQKWAINRLHAFWMLDSFGGFRGDFHA